jgi:RNA polymerase sigma factor (sigma-70 family)
VKFLNHGKTAMPQTESATILQQLRWLFCADQNAGLSDGELLERFLQHGDELAFAGLVQRHGRLVLGVCRRVLRHVQDAEDVFQATFVILARKGNCIRRREAIGSWLYQTAYRLAHKMRARAKLQRVIENHATRPVATDPLTEVSWREVRDILDEELARLADKYRAPLLLCYFEGRTQEEAARQLCWQPRTVKARLARGRELLRRRLAQRGLHMESALGAGLLATEYSLSHLPASLAVTTCRAAALIVAGESGTTIVSSAALTIVQGAMRQMAAISILKIGLTSAVLLGVLGSGLAMMIGQERHAAEKVDLKKKADLPRDKKHVPQAVPPPMVDARGDPLPPGAVLRLGTPRLRHGGAVISVVWSPDGSWIASCAGNFDNCVSLWDAATGKEKLQFQQHKQSVTRVGISPDGKLAASVDVQKLLYLWETETGKVLGNRRLDSNSPLVFAADCKSFAAIDEQGQACLVNAAAPLQTLRVYSAGPGLQRVTCATWSTDEKLLATVTNLGKVHLFDAVTGKVLKTLEHSSDVKHASFSPDCKTLAVAAEDKTVHLWQTASGQKIRLLEGHQAPVFVVAWSPDSKSLVSGGDDGTARLWDVDKGQQLRKFSPPTTRVQCAAISPDGKRLATAGMGSEDRVRIWEMDTGKELLTDDEHGGWLAAIAVIEGGKTVVTSASDDMLRLWDVRTGKRVGQLKVPRARAKGIAVTVDGKLLAAGADDGVIRILELPTGNLVKELKADNTGVTSVAFSPDGKWLVSNSASKQTWLWDVGTGEIIRALKHPPESISSFAFGPDCKVLWMGAASGMLYVWDPINHQEIRRLPVHTREVEQLVVSPDGKLMVSLGKDSTARVWNLSTNKEVRVFKWTSFGAAVAFSPDGRMLATGQGRPIIRLWELATGKERAQLEGHRGAVAALAFLPDGKTLVSGSADSTALFWDLSERGRPVTQLPVALAAERIQAEWKSLHGEDANRAYRALLTLSANPGQALAKVKTELQQAPRVDSKLIGQWVADLDDKKFAVREKAVSELKRAGDLAWPALRSVVDNPPSLEAQKRARQLIGNQDDPLLPVPDRLRLIRSLELLERLGTPEARELVQILADGAPEAWLTQEAKSMLPRLKARE